MAARPLDRLDSQRFVNAGASRHIKRPGAGALARAVSAAQSTQVLWQRAASQHV